MPLIAHSDRAFSLPAVFSQAECDALIALAQAAGFEPAGVRMASGQRAMPLIRKNERVVLELPSWVALLWERIAPHLTQPIAQLPAAPDGQTAQGLPKDLRFYKYSIGERFKMHKDGAWTERGLTSQLTLLVYLNEGFEGGDTQFRDCTVTPQTGDALLFIHDTWHEGTAVTSGVKYVLRSDVLYG
jgi:predicted 2-oxoglutarate/Fe(II)-dependent dioxygenase YbiX